MSDRQIGEKPMENQLDTQPIINYEAYIKDPQFKNFVNIFKTAEAHGLVLQNIKLEPKYDNPKIGGFDLMSIDILVDKYKFILICSCALNGPNGPFSTPNMNILTTSLASAEAEVVKNKKDQDDYKMTFIIGDLIRVGSALKGPNAEGHKAVQGLIIEAGISYQYPVLANTVTTEILKVMINNFMKSETVKDEKGTYRTEVQAVTSLETAFKNIKGITKGLAEQYNGKEK